MCDVRPLIRSYITHDWLCKFNFPSHIWLCVMGSWNYPTATSHSIPRHNIGDIIVQTTVGIQDDLQVHLHTSCVRWHSPCGELIREVKTKQLGQ